MSAEIKQYVESCQKCIISFPNRKRQPCCQIIPEYPRERYQMDLVELHQQIVERSGNEARYLFKVIDHL